MPPSDIFESLFTDRYDIAYSIMKRKKLSKLRGELAAMRQRVCRARDFEQMAKSLGRKLDDRGKHPMWISEEFDLPPLSIQHHGGKDIPKPTARYIIDQLEEDLLAWEEYLEDYEDGESQDHD